MGAQRKQYKITKRYMSGPEVVGYHLEELETGRNRRFNRDEVAYLVGRGQVINCEGQLYKDKVYFRGVGCNLDKLEAVQVNDIGSKTSNKTNSLSSKTDSANITFKDNADSIINKDTIKIIRNICNNISSKTDIKNFMVRSCDNEVCKAIIFASFDSKLNNNFRLFLTVENYEGQKSLRILVEDENDETIVNTGIQQIIDIAMHINNIANTR